MSRQSAGFGQRAPEQELDLGVRTAQLVRRPSSQRVVDGGIEPKQDALTLSHTAPGRPYS
jgi:hypothetical protein